MDHNAQIVVVLALQVATLVAVVFFRYGPR